MGGYVDENYHIHERLIKDIENKKFDYPQDLLEFKSSVAELVRSIYSADNYTASYDEKAGNIDESVIQSWNAIKTSFDKKAGDLDSISLTDNYYRSIDFFDIPIWWYDDLNYQILYITSKPESK